MEVKPSLEAPFWDSVQLLHYFRARLFTRVSLRDLVVVVVFIKSVLKWYAII